MAAYVYHLKTKGIRLCKPEGVFDLNDRTPQKTLEYLFRRGYKEVEIIREEKAEKRKQEEQGG